MTALLSLPGASSRLREKQERIAAVLARFQAEQQPDAAHLPPEMGRILNDIHRHLFDPALNVNAVKARCGIRDNNVSSRFRRTLGIGIREYIEGLRLAAADRLLRDGDLEVYLVAMAIGYDHEETFCRAFRRRFGRTPSQERPGARAGSL